MSLFPYAAFQASFVLTRTWLAGCVSESAFCLRCGLGIVRRDSGGGRL